MKSEFLKFSSKRILFSTVVTSVLMAGSPLEVFAADATEVQAVMQTGTVTGQVVDANGEPVIGASILIKGTGTGIITDINGNFTVHRPMPLWSYLLWDIKRKKYPLAVKRILKSFCKRILNCWTKWWLWVMVLRRKRR